MLIVFRLIQFFHEFSTVHCSISQPKLKVSGWLYWKFTENIPFGFCPFISLSQVSHSSKRKTTVHKKSSQVPSRTNTCFVLLTTFPECTVFWHLLLLKGMTETDTSATHNSCISHCTLDNTLTFYFLWQSLMLICLLKWKQVRIKTRLTTSKEQNIILSHC